VPSGDDAVATGAAKAGIANSNTDRANNVVIRFTIIAFQPSSPT
jgi:hypothetical protein